MLREQKLHTVCEEAACPNIGECFGRGTATFMILGDICTRRCPFCDVGHGKPLPPDPNEPANLADSVAASSCAMWSSPASTATICATAAPSTSSTSSPPCATSRRPPPSKPWSPISAAAWTIAIDVLGQSLPDVLNHNMETVPSPLQAGPPRCRLQHSLDFLKQFKARYPQVPTKSGLMVGLGETDEEILEVMRDLRAHGVEMLTIGQYLAPSGHHLPVSRATCIPTPSRCSRPKRKWVSPAPPAARWCVQLLGRPAGAQRRRDLTAGSQYSYCDAA
jgi:lipoic acid synthetase